MTDSDYVIVGAGSAGCVLAEALTRDGFASVTLLEAGPPDRRPEVRVPAVFPRLFGTEYDWAFSTAPQPGLDGRRLYWPRGRTLGGSSSVNAQIWTRGHRLDYDAWGSVAPGWGFDDLWPHFATLERRSHAARRTRTGRMSGAGQAGTRTGRTDHAATGAVETGEQETPGPLWVQPLREPDSSTEDFLLACENAGLRRLAEANVPEPEGAAAVTVTQRSGRRWSSADAFLRPAEGRPNLQIRTGSHVERITLRGSRVVAVEYIDEHGTRQVAHASREIILAAGAVGSPHLLLRSGIGPPDQLPGAPNVDGLQHALPGVGRGLQDHLFVPLVHGRRGGTGGTGAADLSRYLAVRRGPLSSNLAEALAFLRSSPTEPAPDLELLWMPVQFVDHGRAERGPGITLGVILLQPHSHGVVELAGTNPQSSPAIDPRYLSEPADSRRLVAGLSAAAEILAAEPLSRLVGEPLHPEPLDAAYVRAHAESLYHPTGTCRIGEVVDGELRVYGLEGLRVVDASVMPQIPRGHTQAPTVLIAHHAAQLIRAS